LQDSSSGGHVLTINKLRRRARPIPQRREVSALQAGASSLISGLGSTFKNRTFSGEVWFRNTPVAPAWGTLLSQCPDAISGDNCLQIGRQLRPAYFGFGTDFIQANIP